MGDYIKIDRRILEWEWYGNEHTKSVFFHCLLKANWKDGKFEGKFIPRGSFVTSIKKLAFELNLTEDETRTALKHLLQTGEITKQTTSKYTVITVSRYDTYQNVTKQIPNNSQSIPERFPTIEERKEKKECIKNTMCKNEEKEAKELFEKLWLLYPNKKGKGQVSMAAKKRLLKVGHDEMARAIGRYTDELEKDSDWRKPQNGSTFFNSGYIDYLDANYVPGERKNKKSQAKSFAERDMTKNEMDELERQLLMR